MVQKIACYRVSKPITAITYNAMEKWIPQSRVVSRHVSNVFVGRWVFDGTAWDERQLQWIFRGWGGHPVNRGPHTVEVVAWHHFELGAHKLFKPVRGEILPTLVRNNGQNVLSCTDVQHGTIVESPTSKL